MKMHIHTHTHEWCALKRIDCGDEIIIRATYRGKVQSLSPSLGETITLTWVNKAISQTVKWTDYLTDKILHKNKDFYFFKTFMEIKKVS